jgi:hypothetical protein
METIPISGGPISALAKMQIHFATTDLLTLLTFDIKTCSSKACPQHL